MGSGNHRKSGRSGFTLLEVMIVVAIVTVLAAIAYPSYLNQLIKGRRAAAESYLMDLAQRQQQYLLDARSYADDATLKALAPVPNDVSPYYVIFIDNTKALNPAPTPAFTITATAQGPQTPDGNLQIDNQGTKTPSTKW